MAKPQEAHQKDVVLVVDDEQIILRMATSALASAGFRAIVAENGAAGLEAFIENADQICLVLTDVVMPYLSGLEMAQRILAARPGTRILLMSGYSDRVIQVGTQFPLLRKPFLPERLVSEIQRLLEQAGGAQTP
jgi:two-component system cell cycle sensor histidine kinase/response regulator CckA